MQGSTTGRMIIFHPILFALYPPIALLANNILQIRPVDALRSVVVFLIFGSLVFLVSWLIVRNWMQAGLLSSVFLLSFSIYGQVYDALEKSNTADLVIGRHRFLAPIWLVLTVAILIFVVRSKGDLKIGNQLFNLISVILIGFPIIQLGSSAWSTYQNSRSNSETVSQITHTLGQQTVAKPDVYYIILDMYGRDDVLLDKFKFDNTEFLANLEEMGFYVGRCSMSNYNMTELSLASSFNMEYLQKLGDQFKAGNRDRSGLPSLIHQSAVRHIFEDMGYQVINFETGFNFTEIRDADQFLSPSYHELDVNQTIVHINSFESMLVRTTAISAILDAQTKWFHPVADALDTRKAHVIRELFVLDKLPSLAIEEGPKFVYAHILIPHPPFVFSSEGININFPGNDGATPVGPTPKDYATGYRNQLEYINNRILPILEQIISDSKNPPIIILQGDHGVDPKRSFILNAYYLPDDGTESLYQTITPVNTFRFVLNQYFQGDYPLLADINYASNDSSPFDFDVVKDHRVCP
jgi:hypothetical protein